MTGITAAAILSAFLLFGCDQLQDSLSVEQEADLLEETGTLSVSAKNWYYNGSASSDVSSDSGFLTLTSSKQIAESTSGVSVSFEISYTDASGNSTSVTKSGSGSIASSGKAFNVDMSPVLAVLNGSGSTTKDNTATAKVKVSGLVCNEGDQKGRSLDAFEKSVSVKPLFSTTTLSGVTFSTLNSTLGNSIEIPTQDSELFLSSAQIAQIDGDVPSGVSISDFALSSDGSTIKITPSVDLYNVVGTVEFTVSGICSATNEVGYTQTFSAKLGKMVSTTDKWESAPASTAVPNYSMETMIVSVDSDNLYVTINGAVTPSAWGTDQLVIFVDDTSIGDETTTYSTLWGQQAGTTQTVNTSVEFTGYDIPNNEWANLKDYRTNSWKWEYEASDYAYYAVDSDSKYITSLEYTIPLSKIDTNATASDTFRVAAAWGMYWKSGDVVQFENGIPGSSFTVSTTTNENDTVSIDFSKALILGSDEEVSVAPSAPKYFAATAATSESITLTWSEAYNAETYTLIRKGDTDTTVLDAGTATTATDTGLSAGTSYTYELYASNSSGNSAVKTLTASTSALPCSFTVTPSYTFSGDGTDVSLTWTASDSATSYKVEYKKSTDSDYTTATESTTDTSAKLSSLAMGSYTIKVTASNSAGSTTAAATASLYPTITLDGTMSDSECWTNTNVAGASTDSGYTNGDTENSKISGLYITNDGENLYIAVDFGSAVPRLLSADSHIGFIISASSSTETTVSAGYGKGGIATTTTLTNGGGYVFNFADQTSNDGKESWEKGTSWSGVYPTTVTSNNKWLYEWTTVNTWKGSSTVCEYKVPLSAVGKSAGDTICIVAGTSDYSYDESSSSNCWAVKDVVPWSSATLSKTTINNDTLSVDLSKALSYIIK